MKKFRLALAGGTFDRLHAGHEKFLRAAFEKSQTVWIGLTSDWFAKKKEYGGSVEKYGERKSALVSFLKKNRLTRRSKIIKINGVAGPQAANPKVNAIIATGETLKGARKINALRRAAGVKPAKIELVEYVLAQDRKRISSTGVRQGRISRQGKVYLRRFESALRLPRRLIGAMRRPLGKLFCDGDYASAARKAWESAKEARLTVVATVGDECYRQFLKMGITPDLSIIDGKIKRVKVDVPKEAKSAIRASNRRGTVSPSLVRAIKKAVKRNSETGKPVMIFVRGEEDLAALPAILALPLGSALFYGMPNEGVVLVLVGEKEKENASRVIGRFER